jgi:2Fe-2S ferredoxin
MAMCASCQCYVLNDVTLPEMGDDEEAMLLRGILCQVEQSFRLPNSITESLEGLELELAPEINKKVPMHGLFFIL